jgi:photosystem II stability/assembly factor-like uncharacterized protein
LGEKEKMDLRTRIVLAGVLFGMSMTAAAGVNTWSPIGPDGGAVSKVVYNRNRPTTLYMAADAGFLRSVNNGLSWQLTKADLLNGPFDLAVDPTDPDRVYFTVNGAAPGLFVSTDGGVSFQVVPEFQGTNTATHIEAGADGQTLYFATGTAFYRSTDRGVSWQQRAYPNGFYAPTRLVVDAANPSTLYAGMTPNPPGVSTVELFVSQNGGDSWTPVPAAAASAGYIYDIAVSATTPRRIWVAGANGLHVSDDLGLNFDLAGALGPVQTIGLNPDDPANLYVGLPYGSVFRTTDAGASFEDVTGNVPSGQPLTIVARSAQSQTEVFVGGLGGLATSAVGGTTWVSRDTGHQGTRVASLSADVGSDRIYIATEHTGGYFIAGGASVTTPVDNDELRDVLLSQQQPPTRLWVPALLAQTGTPGRLIASLSNIIVRSTDGGANWTPTNFVPAPGRQIFSLTSSASAPEVILGGSPQSLYRSADGGNSWTPATIGLPSNAYVETVVLSPSNPLVAYAAPVISGTVGTPPQTFGVYRSNDAGLTWSPVNTGIEDRAIGAIEVDPSDSQLVYIGTSTNTGATLLKTANGGSSWTELSGDAQFGPVTAIAVDARRPQTLYVAQGNRLRRSIDGGASWETLRDPQTLPWWPVTKILPDPNRPHVVLVGTRRSGAQQITISPDLELAQDSPSGTVTIGTSSTYRYTVTNRGPFHATGAAVTLQVPASAQSVSLESSTGSCSTSGTLRCSLGDLRNGGSATVTVRVTPSAAGAFQVAASAQSDQPDPAMGNNTQVRDATAAAAPPPSPPTTPPPPASSGGGGGAFSILWLLLLGAIAAGAARSRQRG